MTPEKQLVYVAGSGRSGSTLLDLLLNNSPFVQSVGEFHRLAWYARTNREYCTCGKPVAGCPFWLKVQQTAEQSIVGPNAGPLLKHLDPMIQPGDLSTASNVLEKAILVAGIRPVFQLFLALFARKHRDALLNSLFWYDMIRQSTGKPIILDSTKDPRRLSSLYLFQPGQMRVLFLVRDGRAVAASAMRRLGEDMSTAAAKWVGANRRSLLAQRGVRPSQKMMLRYEDLCTDPGGSLRSVCQFIGIPFDHSMLVLRKTVSHNIGGNPMRFRKGEDRIVLDESWRDQLTQSDLAEFERIGGRMNSQLGYTQ